MAVRQLKESTRTRHLDGLFRVYDLIGTAEARNARRYIYNSLTSPPNRITAAERMNIELVSVSFDRVGRLVSSELVPPDVFYASHAETVIRCWITLRPYVMHHRAEIGGHHVRYFEELAARVQRYWDDEHPGDVIEVRKLWVQPAP